MGIPLLHLRQRLLAAKAPSTPIIVPTARCFVISGRPVFLISGAIHYFRVPHELWRDRLLQAKRAGLNCVETYIAWNFHETEEGQFRFDGDRDISKYLSLCKELGLYVFLRSGPYIDAEWEAGGFPAWLLAKAGAQFRTMNSTVLPYVRRWFEQVIPRIVRFQATHGGPLILVQSENEYHFIDRPGGPEYLDFLFRTLRELGIEVPITDCNDLDVRVPGSLKTINTDDPSSVRRYREANPGNPAFVSEFWIGGLDFWGFPSDDPNPPAMVEGKTMAILAQGAMYSFYMFHGGTNFGYWASNSVRSDHSWITTRYDRTSPVLEGGGLSEKYFAVKRVNLLATNFQNFFCEAEPALPHVQVAGPCSVTALQSRDGQLLFILPSDPIRIETAWRTDGGSPFRSLEVLSPDPEIADQAAFLRLPSGDTVPLAENCSTPCMIPIGFRINSSATIDFSNATLLGCVGTPGRQFALFRGQSARKGIVSINGERAEFVFPSDEIFHKTIAGVGVFALPRKLADRTWFADGRTIIGPDYVGHMVNGRHECCIAFDTDVVHTISVEGDYAQHHVSGSMYGTSRMELTGWQRLSFEKAQALSQDWVELRAPESVEGLGAYYGYCWYQASFIAMQQTHSSLFFTHAGDRIHVYMDGKRIAVWGRGEDATRDLVPVALSKGQNHFTFLCDNMGRDAEGSLSDRKGIWGDVYVDASEVCIQRHEYTLVSGPPRSDTWAFKSYLKYGTAAHFRYFRIRIPVRIPDGNGATLVFRWVPQYAWIYVNNSFVSDFVGNEAPILGGTGFGEFTLDPFLVSSQTEIDLWFFGDPSQDLVRRIHLFTYPMRAALVSWRFKPLERPADESTVGSAMPAWWECDFPMPNASPVFLVTKGLSKGQAYLNGSAVGRYWEVGPQRTLYLPEPWLRQRNVLAIFDEEGNSPYETYIVSGPSEPCKKVLV